MTRSIGVVRKRLGALPAGLSIGALCGALVGGVLGRVYMRLIFLQDQSKDGALTDFGTAGQVTVRGSLNLALLCAVTGAIGGMLYVGVRRWLPGRSTRARGLAFGLLMTFVPGVIFIGPVDLQIFEPALLIYVGFVALFVLYGVGVALLTDRMRPPARTLDRSGRSRRAATVAALVGLAWAAFVVGNVAHNSGTCLSGDDNGGCAIPTK